MNVGDGSTVRSTGSTMISRRAAVREIVGIAAVLAIPVGAVLATANPIPDPPSRKALNFAPLPIPVTEQQERPPEREKRRADKKARDARESRPALSEEEPRSDNKEQRASHP